MRAVDSRIDVILRHALSIDEVFSWRSILLVDLVPGRILIAIGHCETSAGLFGWSKIRGVSTQSRREITFNLLHDFARTVHQIFAGLESGDRNRSSFVLQQFESAAPRGLHGFTKRRQRRRCRSVQLRSVSDSFERSLRDVDCALAV